MNWSKISVPTVPSAILYTVMGNTLRSFWLEISNFFIKMTAPQAHNCSRNPILHFAGGIRTAKEVPPRHSPLPICYLMVGTFHNLIVADTYSLQLCLLKSTPDSISSCM